MVFGRRIKEHPILNFERGKKVSFTFDGKVIEGYKNETIAAALHAAGVKVYRYTAKKNHPRGFFCAIGKCSSLTKLREGMKVETQRGRGELFETSKC